ncbi:MAG: MBL fold metallo-hydrolase [Rhodospirillaceae bacterium]|jgi:glyoxylase-like metal-dependent hydrolase (beta-lactamase superfamily II)|nr:MBL fold metallo-hydrolase [Rhodospirillaceae bacterium]MBT3808833.1 MBL fold metallo-hydrolase [Rhodospirillaceae bacterium]MBT3930998.1 MBL fold metallo-hydrolase [Rhodospirillaceae bacterium]MBT4772744.1 MBL fold metallo-hydrolase [Rhodospirillaceae bacterium]MBT5359324.1 MBL fold metallo-hydrolase [Rhodospirillaceae bacterium]
MIRLRSLAAIAAATMMFTGVLAPQAGAQQEVKRSITEIGPNLYRFKNNFHSSVFLVTDAGVVATDPINAAAATWLENEIRTRFGQEIRYVVYSHDHADHISGGEVWDDTAVVVSHVNARDTIIAAKRPTAVPELTFSDELILNLGGQTVELKHVGRNHSDNMIVMNFPAQRVLFAVDFIPIQAVAFRDLPDAWLPDWIDSVRAVEGMDFDTLAPGHGKMGTPADVTAFREYMEDLWAAVSQAVADGKTLEQAQAEIKLPKYAGWGRYEQFLPLNIAGAYRVRSANWRR